MIMLMLSEPQDRDHVLRNGGVLVGEYPDGWLLRVRAEQIGEVSYRLADGSVVRRFPTPSFVTY